MNSAEIITKLNKMTQEKINYSEIMALGFTEDIQHDSVYEAEHGYSYCIITKQLTKKIYLDWQKDTKLCKLVRLSKPKTGDIGAEIPIKNLDHLKEMINFFSNVEDIETIESQTLYSEGTIDRKNYKGESAINYGFESVWNAEKQQLEYTFYFQGEKEEGTVLESELQNWYF